MWTPLSQRSPDQIPKHFLRCSLSRLMWDYAMRTTRDVLPKRYRSDVLYFRRPPRLPQRLLGDSQLLLLRELATAPGSFNDLLERTGLKSEVVAQDLGALYLVGAITSNARRAAPLSSPIEDSGLSAPSSMPHSRPFDSGPLSLRHPHPWPRGDDRTAPAPLNMDK
jgi:hypothetical protein